MNKALVSLCVQVSTGNSLLGFFFFFTCPAVLTARLWSLQVLQVEKLAGSINEDFLAVSSRRTNSGPAQAIASHATREAWIESEAVIFMHGFQT